MPTAVTHAAVATATTERYLAWGQLATGTSLLLAWGGQVLSGESWFDAAIIASGTLLAVLGAVALLVPAPVRSRLGTASRHIEPAVFGGLLVAGPDEDTGYVLALAMIMLILAALRGRSAHRVSLVVVVVAEVIRQALHPVVGDPVEPVETVVGLGLALGVSVALGRLVEQVRQSEAEARRSEAATAAALAEAERAAIQLDVMHRVVVSTLGTDETTALDRIVTEIASYLDVPAVTVFLTTPDGRPYIAATSDPTVSETDRVSPVADGPFVGGALGRALDGHPARSTPAELDAQASSDLPWRGDVTVDPLRRANGTVVGALACATAADRVFTDTEVRTIGRFADQASLAIEAARALDREADLAAQYRELDRLKTDFVAITSHELRTPLTTVLGVVETMRQRLHDIEATDLERLVTALGRQAHRLSRLVDDLRTVSRVDAGTLTTLVRPTDVGAVVHEAVQGMPDLDVRLEVAVGLPKAVADPDRLIQVMTNLLANGEQHGAGPVHVSVDTDASHVVVQVWDEGPGIPGDRRDDVFDRFVRLGDTDSHSRGTGLGLAIARELTEAMHGSIEVVDRGSHTAFEVRLAAT